MEIPNIAADVAMTSAFRPRLKAAMVPAAIDMTTAKSSA
jgi:hypothetical protein